VTALIPSIMDRTLLFQFPAPLAQAPDWQLAEDAHRIGQSFRFRNFREALTFFQISAN
jgi:pterin-4a-carbinolamine dehydratase